MSPSAKVGSMMIPPIIELWIYDAGQQPVETEERTFEMDDVQGVSLFYACSLLGKQLPFRLLFEQLLQPVIMLFTIFESRRDLESPYLLCANGRQVYLVDSFSCSLGGG